MSEWSDQQLKDALRKDRWVRWKTRLQEREAGRYPDRPPRRPPTWAVAAAVAALAAVGLWLFWPTPNPSPTELFAEYFSPLPNVLAPEVRGSDQQTALQQALQSYATADYEVALSAFDQVATSERTAGYFLYRGITELALEQGPAAQASLAKVTGDSFRFSQQWYLSLAYLQEDQLDEARQLLEQIQDAGQHPYQKQASELLLKLP